MSHALMTQEGGNHYKAMGMQPVEFCAVNRYDPTAFSALKYVSRHHVKNGREDLLKGRHFIRLRRDLRRDHPSLYGFKALDVIPVSEYTQANNISGLEASILIDLHVWALGQLTLSESVIADLIIQKFDCLIDMMYPQKEK